MLIFNLETFIVTMLMATPAFTAAAFIWGRLKASRDAAEFDEWRREHGLVDGSDSRPRVEGGARRFDPTLNTGFILAVVVISAIALIALCSI